MIPGCYGKIIRVWAAALGSVCSLASLPLSAAQTTLTTRDTLAYKDGDRVQGMLVSQTADEIVFKTDRFGEVRVKTMDAVVIKADKPAAPPAPAVAQAAPPPVPTTRAEKRAAAEKAEEERVSMWDRFSPSVLTARVRNYFGPWHGRLAFSTEAVSDVARRDNSSYEGHLTRKWTTNEVQLNARYDYSETNNVTTTDIVKASALLRHEFNKQIFGLYRPTSEWNRASTLNGKPNDYVLLQQEFGAGWQVVAMPSRKVRVGLSENRFDTWNNAHGAAGHISRGAASGFEELEFTLPWRITLSQRGVYYPVQHQRDGWENRFDVLKKLTETLSMSVRHEIRRRNPDGAAQDYDRLKLLFGLDF